MMAVRSTVLPSLSLPAKSLAEKSGFQSVNKPTRIKLFAVHKRNAAGYVNCKHRLITASNISRLKHSNSKIYLKNEEVEAGNYSSSNALMKLVASLKVFYTFTRPYACWGIIYGIASSSLTAVERLSDISLPFLIAFLKTAATFSFLIVYVNGLNQIYDIEIDKINKPFLPLASGEMSLGTSIVIILACAAMAFGMAISIGSKPLLWGLSLFFIILSAYSVDLPLLRWKNTAIGAAFSVMASFGPALQLGTYFHMQTFVLNREATFSRPLVYGIVASIMFYLAIALFKDVPDMEGDEKFGVKSLAGKLGKNKVLWICVYIIQIFYSYAIVAGATSSHLWSKCIIILSHAILSPYLWKHAKSLDLNSKSAILTFYVFLWKLLYAEYLLIPLVR